MSAALAPCRGLLTWSSEGQEGGRYTSRKLQVPSNTSGVTIGRGYDMSQKDPGQILAQLTMCGVAKFDATILSGAAWKNGKAARDFIVNNKLQEFEISQAVQLKLFTLTYAEKETYTRYLTRKADVVSVYGRVDWDQLNDSIKQVLVDLTFRGDYDGTARAIIQKSVVENDEKAFTKALSIRENWPTVPGDRFKRRVDFLQQAPPPPAKPILKLP